MFDNWIGLGPLAEAYNLNADECIEVARHVPCKFGPSSGNQPYDLEKIGDLAREAADKSEKKAAQDAEAAKGAISFMFSFVQSQWHKKGGTRYEDYKHLLEKGLKQEASDALWLTVRLVHILDLKVNKSEAVLFLARNGYPFKTEVKGLSKAIVDSILATNTAAHETPQTTLTEPGKPSPAHATAPPDTPLTVKNRVASIADKALCGKKTREENSNALAWITYWRAINWSKKEIADALKEAGASDAVIGYLLAPEGEALSKIDHLAAQKRGRRARGLS